MIWAAKTYPVSGQAEAEKTFRQLFAMQKLNKGMLLVSERQGRKVRLLIGLPSQALLSDFPGFGKVSVGQFPSRSRVSLLLGNRDEFDKWFS